MRLLMSMTQIGPSEALKGRLSDSMWQAFVCIMISPLPENVFKMTFEKKCKILFRWSLKLNQKLILFFQ